MEFTYGMNQCWDGHSMIPGFLDTLSQAHETYAMQRSSNLKRNDTMNFNMLKQIR